MADSSAQDTLEDQKIEEQFDHSAIPSTKSPVRGVGRPRGSTDNRARRGRNTSGLADAAAAEGQQRMDGYLVGRSNNRTSSNINDGGSNNNNGENSSASNNNNGNEEGKAKRVTGQVAPCIEERVEELK